MTLCVMTKGREGGPIDVRGAKIDVVYCNHAQSIWSVYYNTV